jgi:hypothetical protein
MYDASDFRERLVVCGQKVWLNELRMTCNLQQLCDVWVRGLPCDRYEMCIDIQTHIRHSSSRHSSSTFHILPALLAATAVAAAAAATTLARAAAAAGSARLAWLGQQPKPALQGCHHPWFRQALPRQQAARGQRRQQAANNRCRLPGSGGLHRPQLQPYPQQLRSLMRP